MQTAFGRSAQQQRLQFNSLDIQPAAFKSGGIQREQALDLLLCGSEIVDQAIPFSTLAFPAYVSLWVYVSLPTALMSGFRSLLLLGLWSAALCLFCLALFWGFPTTVPPVDIDWHLYPEMALIKGIDAAGNACPSLHVASAVFSAVWLERVLVNVAAPVWLRCLSGVQCLVIMWSTVATRQHVVLDVIAGALVGLVFGWASLRQIESALGRQGI